MQQGFGVTRQGVKSFAHSIKVRRAQGSSSGTLLNERCRRAFDGGQRHDGQPGAPADHAHYAIETVGANTDLHARAAVQRLFFQIDRQSAVGAESYEVVAQGVAETDLSGV